LAWHGQGRLLDFGCGSGAFLQLMRQQGWTVQGVDSADAAVEHLKLLGIPAFQGSLPHPELPRESFDVVTMWSSLEHVHDPLETLRAAADLLVPGGQLHLVVPNFESWSARNFGEAWFGLDLPRHLTHFTSDTLGIMTRKAGFEIERCTTLRHSSWLQKSAKLAIRKRRATLVQRLLRLRPVSHAASFVCHLLGASDALYLQARRP
jgi:SAM-dependent methyltransferase